MFNRRLCSGHYFFGRRQATRAYQQDKAFASQVSRFSDSKSTQHFLSQFRDDYYAMNSLRGLLSESRRWVDVSRLTSDQVLSEVTRMAQGGELGAAVRPRSYSAGTSSNQASSSPAPLPAAAPVASSQPEESDPATFSPGSNGAVQAAALSAAAASGAAFCPH